VSIVYGRCVYAGRRGRRRSRPHRVFRNAHHENEVVDVEIAAGRSPFDHTEIVVDTAVEAANNVGYSRVAQRVLPAEFTLAANCAEAYEGDPRPHTRSTANSPSQGGGSGNLLPPTRSDGKPPA